MFICLPKKEIFTRHTEKNIPMIYRPHYPWYLTPGTRVNLVTNPVIGDEERIVVVWYFDPHGKLTGVNFHPWYFDPLISNQEKIQVMFICLPKKEIFTRHTEKNIPMIYRPPSPWYLTPYQWYFDALPMAF
jgi:hypothetical protein